MEGSGLRIIRHRVTFEAKSQENLPRITSAALTRSSEIFLTSFPTVSWTHFSSSTLASLLFLRHACGLLPAVGPCTSCSFQPRRSSHLLRREVLSNRPSKVVPSPCRFSLWPCLVSLRNPCEHPLCGKLMLLLGYCFTTPPLSKIQVIRKTGPSFHSPLYPQCLACCLACCGHTINICLMSVWIY